MLIFVVVGVLFICISIGTYYQKRITLILVVPYAIFSAGYFERHVFTENALTTYAYQSTFMLVLSILTLHVLIFNQKVLTPSA